MHVRFLFGALFAGALTLCAFALPASAGPTTVCGDGAVEGSEVCDDGNTVGGDGCSAGCLPEVCGDGILEPDTEECDDGNTVDGDGCTAACVLECGNNVLDPGEECDDGNRNNGDGCDDMCFSEVCGNGIVQEGEDCDTGAQCEDGSACDVGDAMACTGIGDELCVPNRNDPSCDDVCANVNLDPLDPEEQKCVTTVNKSATNIAKAQGKEALKCLKDTQKGKVPDFDACAVADAKGKIAKQEAKLDKQATKKCNPANLPEFAYIDDLAAVKMAAQTHPVALMLTIFGDPADPAIADKATMKDAAKCQLDVAKRAAKLYDTILKEYDSTKKQALKGSKKVTAVTSNAELSNTLQNATVLSSKVQKKAQQLNEKPAKKCDTVDAATAFPGGCTDASIVNVLQCVTQQTGCEACRHMNEVDGLSINCDLVDNDVEDASCT